MPKWEQYLDEEQGASPKFEKFTKKLRIARHIIRNSEGDVSVQQSESKGHDQGDAAQRDAVSDEASRH